MCGIRIIFYLCVQRLRQHFLCYCFEFFCMWMKLVSWIIKVTTQHSCHYKYFLYYIIKQDGNVMRRNHDTSYYMWHSLLLGHSWSHKNRAEITERSIHAQASSTESLFGIFYFNLQAVRNSTGGYPRNSFQWRPSHDQITVHRSSTDLYWLVFDRAVRNLIFPVGHLKSSEVQSTINNSYNDCYPVSKIARILFSTFISLM